MDLISIIKQDLNLLALKLGEKICIRCSLVAGNYIYGKLAGLSSTKQVTGEIMISLSRMDQYLQEVIKNEPNLPCKSIVLCIDNQLYSKTKQCFINSAFSELASQTAYRETIINSKVIYKEV